MSPPDVHSPDNLDCLFDNHAPHAIIEAHRRQQDESGYYDGASESEDELRRAFEDRVGFGNNSNDEEDDDSGNEDEEAGPHD
jgi:hypothetical protein